MNQPTDIRGHRALELACILLVGAQLGYVAWRIVLVSSGWRDVAGVIVAVLVAHVLADFVSGVAHWAGDTLGTAQTPIIGKHFIRPFRNHHTDPKDITRHDFIETNGNSSIALCVPLMPIVAFMPQRIGVGFWVATVGVATCAWLLATNQFHKWAHVDRPPTIVRALQRAGLALRPSHHDVHHRAPHDTQYCITSGLMNPVLARFRFFRVLEGLLLPGATPAARRSSELAAMSALDAAAASRAHARRRDHTRSAGCASTRSPCSCGGTSTKRPTIISGKRSEAPS